MLDDSFNTLYCYMDVEMKRVNRRAKDTWGGPLPHFFNPRKKYFNP